MAWTNKWYCKAFTRAFSSSGLNLATGDVTALLTTSSYTPDQDSHDFVDDVTNELAGGGYARVDLTTEGVSLDTATNKVKFTSDPWTFAGVTGTFRRCVIFVDSGTAGTSPLVCVIESDTDIVLSGNDVTFTPQAGGIVDVTVS